MKNPLNNPNVKWIFGGIGAAVVGGWIVWKITGATKPEPAQQITTPLYMPGSGGFGGGGGGGGVGPMDDFSFDPMAIMSLMQATEMERIASEERMYMAGLTQSVQQSNPLYIPISESTTATTASYVLPTMSVDEFNVISAQITKSAPKGKEVYIQSSLPSGQTIVSATADRSYIPAELRTNNPTLTAEQQRQGVQYIQSGDWHGLYNLASSVGATSRDVANMAGINYEDVVAWQQQQGLKVL